MSRHLPSGFTVPSEFPYSRAFHSTVNYNVGLTSRTGIPLMHTAAPLSDPCNSTFSPLAMFTAQTLAEHNIAVEQIAALQEAISAKAQSLAEREKEELASHEERMRAIMLEETNIQQELDQILKSLSTIEKTQQSDATTFAEDAADTADEIAALEKQLVELTTLEGELQRMRDTIAARAQVVSEQRDHFTVDIAVGRNKLDNVREQALQVQAETYRFADHVAIHRCGTHHEQPPASTKKFYEPSVIEIQAEKARLASLFAQDQLASMRRSPLPFESKRTSPPNLRRAQSPTERPLTPVPPRSIATSQATTAAAIAEAKLVENEAASAMAAIRAKLAELNSSWTKNPIKIKEQGTRTPLRQQVPSGLGPSSAAQQIEAAATRQGTNSRYISPPKERANNAPRYVSPIKDHGSAAQQIETAAARQGTNSRYVSPPKDRAGTPRGQEREALFSAQLRKRSADPPRSPRSPTKSPIRVDTPRKPLPGENVRVAAAEEVGSNFHVLVACGHLQEAFEQLRLHPDVVHHLNEAGDTPLHVACASDGISLELINALLLQGASTNVKNNRGLTPFHVACLNTSEQELKNHSLKKFLIFKATVNPNQRTAHGETVAHLLCTHDRYLPSLKYLVQSTAVDLDVTALVKPQIGAVHGDRAVAVSPQKRVTPLEKAKLAGVQASRTVQFLQSVADVTSKSKP